MAQPEVQPRSRAGGLSALAVAILLPTAGIIELVNRGPGGDGDNAATSLDYLATSGWSYAISGLALIFAALALLVAVLAATERFLVGANSLVTRSVTVIGLFGSAFLLLGGVLRLSTPGPVVHIASLDRDWGEAAYMAVQMIGTQTFLAGGLFSTAIWIVGVTAAGLRSGTVPTILAIASALPALRVVTSPIGPFIEVPEALWVVSTAALLLGVPVWLAIAGVVLLRRAKPPSLGTV